MLTTCERLFATVSSETCDLHRAHGADIETKQATANDGDGRNEIDIAKLLYHGRRMLVGVRGTQRRSEVGRGRCSVFVCSARGGGQGVIAGRVRAEGFIFREQVLGRGCRGGSVTRLPYAAGS